MLSDKCKSPKGFTMIAHCKAIGKIKRSSGKYVVSEKYKGKYKPKYSASKKRSGRKSKSSPIKRSGSRRK